MSKELEALDRILEAHNRLLDKYNLGGGLGNNYLIIKKAITPPTQEEVCKALSEYVGKEVKYENKNFYFVDYLVKKGRKVEFIVHVPHLKDGLYILMVLPIKLISLVGRFYEGVIVNE